MTETISSLERFDLLEVAGTGGMGTVHRAIDRTTGQPVAVKLLHSVGHHDLRRFEREVRSLASLDHPSIVRYVAHGTAGTGEPFLAMEWLEGEDLSSRLARGRLELAETVNVARQAASALAYAHENGLVHRDVKPSNIFLVGGSVDQVRLLDFGIARTTSGSRALTQTGSMIGTVGYMAPEQATGLADLDARADVFSLGCVLFECVAGQPAFPGDNIMAVLAKLLTDAPPRVRRLRDDVPAGLDAAIDAMLARDRANRTPSMRAVLSALEGAATVTQTERTEPATALTHRERRYVAVVLLRRAVSAGEMDATIAPEQIENEAAQSRSIAERFGATLNVLDGATQLVTVRGAGSANDHALRAARIALDWRELYADARIVIAGGAAETDSQRPIGDAIDRAVACLRDTPARVVSLDPGVAHLLEHRYEIAQVDGQARLVKAHTTEERPRMLLGRPSPCVGRDKELALLGSTLDECIDESSPRAVLVTAVPGAGKSRLRREFVEAARQRHDVRVVQAPCEAVGGAASLSLVRSLVRDAAEVHEADAEDVQLDGLSAHLRALPCEHQRLFAFFAEMLGLRPRDPPSPELIAARGDPLAMSERVKQTVESWLEALTRVGPVLLVLEDVHWIDDASATLLSDVLKRLGEHPIMTLALARPEFREADRPLWRSAEVLEIRLAGLPRRSAERLVRSALGEDTPADLVQRLVTRADGNAFYLEELIRCVNEGRSEALPETVLALVLARLENLDPDERRALRAGSIFGETFWAGGVGALLGDRYAPERVSALLDGLVGREVLQSRRPERFAGEATYSFRHALLREGAYAMLTDDDRQNGHAGAARWLERSGEHDAFVLAEHYDKGNVRDRAAEWYARAARDAIDSGELARGAQLAQRGVALGPTGETMGRLLSVEAVAHLWSDRMQMARTVALESMKFSKPGGADWSFAALAVILSEGIRGRVEFSPGIAATLVELDDIEPSGGAAAVLFNSAMGLLMSGHAEPALRLESQLARMVERTERRDLAVNYGYHATAAFTELVYRFDARSGREHAEAGLDAAKRLGNPIAHVRALATRGGAATLGGRWTDAVRYLREGVALGERGDSTYALNIARLWLLNALWHAGEGREARVYADLLADAEDPHFSVPARCVPVLLDVDEGNATGAVARAIDTLDPNGPSTFAGLVRATIATARLAAGATDEALELSTAAWADRERPLPWHVRSTIDAVHLRALVLAGRREEAQVAFEAARAHVEHILSTIDDADNRAAFSSGPSGRHIADVAAMLARRD